MLEMVNKMTAQTNQKDVVVLNNDSLHLDTQGKLIDITIFAAQPKATTTKSF